MTVPRRYRDIHLPFIVLIRELYRYALVKEDYEGIVVSADERAFYGLTKKLRLPFVQIGSARHYEGSMTYPAFMACKGIEEIWGEANPVLSAFVFKG